MPKTESRAHWVAVPSMQTGASPRKIAPKKSAYNFFRLDVGPSYRESVPEGEFDFAQMNRALGERWRALSARERRPYEQQAEEDAARFERASAEADQAKEAERAAKRAAAAAAPESRMRARKPSAVPSPRPAQRADPAKARLAQLARESLDARPDLDVDAESLEADSGGDADGGDADGGAAGGAGSVVTGSVVDYGVDVSGLEARELRLFRELRGKERRRRARAAERAQLKAQRARMMKEQERLHARLAADRKIASQKRLKFLMSQSSIFAHFMNSAGRPNAPPSPRTSAKGKGGERRSGPRRTSPRGGPPTPSKRGDRGRMAEAEEDEELLASALSATASERTRLTAQPPNVVGGTMRPYQLEGLNWLIQLHESGVNGILADEMGLGKTLQTISLLAFLQHYKEISGPHLVIVPKSTLGNWILELNRWCPTLRAFKFHGSKAEREAMTRHELEAGLPGGERRFDVCVTSYEVAILAKTQLKKFAWQYLAIDEAHRLKNENSKLARTLRELSTMQRLLITGTPLQNNLHELWALLNFLLPEVFSSSEDFDAWFDLATDDDEAKEKMIHQLHKIMRPFMLRRLKCDVATDLLPKIKTHLYVGMTDMQRDLYKKILLREMDMFAAAAHGKKSKGSRVKLCNILMQLRKVCNHPYLFDGVEDRSLDPMGEHLMQNCGKMVLLDKLLRKLKERGSRVLIFSQMTRLLDILEDFCAIRDYSYCRIDGNTSGEDRQEQIEAYNAPGSPHFLFLLSTRAGGLGINLYTADTVVLYDSDWNPQVDLQAQDRAHRIGQKKQVHVYRMMTESSVEEKIIERAEMKLRLDAVVVQNGRLPESSKQLTKQEMQEMVQYGANEVFRAKGSMLTDEDIDQILAKGKERTEAMREKMDARCGGAEKGGVDLLNFRMDSSSLQKWEGEDYSREAQAEKKKKAELERMMAAEFMETLHDGMGQRARSRVNYDAKAYFRSVLNAKEPKMRRVKLPKMFRLPRMQPWHLFDEARLREIERAAESRYLEWKANPPMEQVPRDKKEREAFRAAALARPPPKLISDEMEAEKARLLAEAFPAWTRRDMMEMVAGMERHGRGAGEAAAVHGEMLKRGCDRPLEEVRRYAERFWARGPQQIPDFAKLAARVERGEKKLAERQNLVDLARRFVSRYPVPWEQIRLRYASGQQKDWRQAQDRFVLCWTVQNGFGRWDELQRAIRGTADFAFDYLFRTRTPEELEKRCRMLLRMCAKLVRDEEARDERQKHSVAQSAENGKENVDTQEPSPASTALGGERRVPDASMPALAAVMAKADVATVPECVAEFRALCPQASKRQVVEAIRLIAVKEKRAGDARCRWHVRSAFAHLLTEAGGTSAGAPSGAGGGEKRALAESAETEGSKRIRLD